jgi:hypothetical protein
VNNFTRKVCGLDPKNRDVRHKINLHLDLMPVYRSYLLQFSMTVFPMTRSDRCSLGYVPVEHMVYGLLDKCGTGPIRPLHFTNGFGIPYDRDLIRGCVAIMRIQSLCAELSTSKTSLNSGAGVCSVKRPHMVMHAIAISENSAE